MFPVNIQTSFLDFSLLFLSGHQLHFGNEGRISHIEHNFGLYLGREYLIEQKWGVGRLLHATVFMKQTNVSVLAKFGGQVYLSA